MELIFQKFCEVSCDVTECYYGTRRQSINNLLLVASEQIQAIDDECQNSKITIVV